MAAGALDRFLAAQEPVLAAVEQELSLGRKASHWMWFIFPQIAGLGSSPTARHFAIADLDEARRYLAHPVLGERLRRHTHLMLGHAGETARAILGTPDDLKFRSSATLFHAAADTPDDRRLFAEALHAFYDGEPDARTLAQLMHPPE